MYKALFFLQLSIAYNLWGMENKTSSFTCEPLVITDEDYKNARASPLPIGATIFYTHYNNERYFLVSRNKNTQNYSALILNGLDGVGANPIFLFEQDQNTYSITSTDCQEIKRADIILSVYERGKKVKIANIINAIRTNANDLNNITVITNFGEQITLDAWFVFEMQRLIKKNFDFNALKKTENNLEINSIELDESSIDDNSTKLDESSLDDDVEFDTLSDGDRKILLSRPDPTCYPRKSMKIIEEEKKNISPKPSKNNFLSPKNVLLMGTIISIMLISYGCWKYKPLKSMPLYY
jgi:hypothetical protein